MGTRTRPLQTLSFTRTPLNGESVMCVHDWIFKRLQSPPCSVSVVWRINELNGRRTFCRKTTGRVVPSRTLIQTLFVQRAQCSCRRPLPYRPIRPFRGNTTLPQCTSTNNRCRYHTCELSYSTVSISQWNRSVHRRRGVVGPYSRYSHYRTAVYNGIRAYTLDHI